MHPGTKPTRDGSALMKLGLVLLSALLLLSLVGCASTSSQVTQPAPASQVEVPVAQATMPVSQPAEERDPLKVCAVVPEEDLKEMRGCLGVYYFDFTFDINMLANPEVSVTTNFTAAVPDGSPAPEFSGTTAVFQDDNVFYVAGPTGNGMISEVIVTGHDNVVFANTNFNIRIPDATLLSPTINIMPAGSLSGIGIK
ncbi:MAG: hypothetical protein P8X65_02205 [Syntrophobacterales bacterium]|jgi:hypothetical protein